MTCGHDDSTINIVLVLFIIYYYYYYYLPVADRDFSKETGATWQSEQVGLYCMHRVRIYCVRPF